MGIGTHTEVGTVVVNCTALAVCGPSPSPPSPGTARAILPQTPVRASVTFHSIHGDAMLFLTLGRLLGFLDLQARARTVV
jgi:hypothetical protein